MAVWLSGFLVFPTKPAIFWLECSTPGTNLMPLQLIFPFYTQAFSVTQLVRPHPASGTSCKAQTQGIKCKYIKEDKRSGKIKPNINSNGLAHRFSLGSQPLVAHFKALESTQLGWVFPVMLGDGAIILTYLYLGTVYTSLTALSEQRQAVTRKEAPRGCCVHFV